MQLPERAVRAADPAKKSLPFFGSTEYGDMHHDGFSLDDGEGDMAGYRRAPEDTGAFEGRSEAQTVFVAHPLDQGRKAAKAKSHGIGVGEGAFKGTTESREAFPGHVVRAGSSHTCLSLPTMHSVGPRRRTGAGAVSRRLPLAVAAFYSPRVPCAVCRVARVE